MDQVQSFRKQNQLYKSKGAGDAAQSNGAWTAELYAKSDITAGTSDASIVPAVTGKKIRVLSYLVSALAAGATNIQFRTKPGGAGSGISPFIALAANGNVAEESEFGLFETNAGEALTASTGVGAGVGVRVTYVLVD